MKLLLLSVLLALAFASEFVKVSIGDNDISTLAHHETFVVNVYNPVKDTGRINLGFLYTGTPCGQELVLYQIVLPPCTRVLDAPGATVEVTEDGSTIVTAHLPYGKELVFEVGAICDWKYDIFDAERSRICVCGKEYTFSPTPVTPKIDCDDYSEQDALKAIYWAASGEQWKSSKNWFKTPVCSADPHKAWHGVDCEGKQNVHHLFLKSNKLKGVLHPAVGCLKFLRTLDVEDNDLFGPLPRSVTGLTGLQHLRIGRNHFTKVPDLCKLRHLQFLYIEDNQITEFPVCVPSDWKFLKEIHAYCNPMRFPDIHTQPALVHLIRTLAEKFELFEVRWYCTVPAIPDCPHWFKELIAKGHLKELLRCDSKNCKCKVHPNPPELPPCPPRKENCPECVCECAEEFLRLDYNPSYHLRKFAFDHCFNQRCLQICRGSVHGVMYEDEEQVDL
ncbi:hypothetical protein RCL1_009001 [Eukaryota sp. TZLM3-RCL]